MLTSPIRRFWLMLLPIPAFLVIPQQIAPARERYANYVMNPSPQAATTASISSVYVKPTPIPTTAPTAQLGPKSAGSHEDWMRAAGIDQADWTYVEFIIAHESGWNPNAVNRSSGACGLGQQLPCGKWPHQWNEPVGALIDASSYAHSRYGGWASAYSHWVSAHWW